MPDLIEHLQWPAMAVTVISVWLVGCESKRKRMWGFWVSLLGNALWSVWGLHDQAYALICLQFGLAGLNIRGACKNVKSQA